MDNFASRLATERRRLNLSQEELGAAGGVKKLAQFNYEKGARFPDSNYLQAVQKIGVDLLYLFTGERVPTQSNLKQELQALSDAWEAVDWALAEAKKTLPPEKKRHAAEALYMAVKTGEGQVKPLARLLSKAA